MNYKQKISILVVTHNHENYILKLIHSLEKFDYDAYFCDAASTDNTLDLLQKSSFSKNILAKKKLEGFSKNNNDLIRHFNLQTDYYLLLNPDLFFEEDFIQKIYSKIAGQDNIGIVAPVVLYPNKKLQVTWKKFPSVLHVAKKRLGFIKSEDEIQVENEGIDWCLGACMLISNKLLKDNYQLLDERYRLYCEDVDICFEAHTKKLRVVGCKDTFVYHHLNELSAKNIFSKYNLWNIQSIFKFALKWNVKYFLRNKNTK